MATIYYTVCVDSEEGFRCDAGRQSLICFLLEDKLYITLFYLGRLFANMSTLQHRTNLSSLFTVSMLTVSLFFYECVFSLPFMVCVLSTDHGHTDTVIAD